MNFRTWRGQLRFWGVTLAFVSAFAVAQEIDWQSIDSGGGVSSAAGIQITGVIGQFDTGRMEGEGLSLSGGLLPLPPRPEVLFENGFEDS